MLEIRRASSLGDRAGAYYVRIEAMARKHGIPLDEEFDEHDGEGTWYVVALDDGFPVATLRMYETGPDAVMLGRIVVLPAYRRRGLGTRCVRAAEEWAKELGYRRAVLESRDNKIAFYRSMAYEQVSDVPVEGPTFTCYRMEKKL